MPEQNYSIEQDLKEAREMANGLESYVHQDELYGKPGGMFGGGGMPSLTIGALLMRLRRLNAMRGRMTESQRVVLDEIQAKHDAVRKDWQMHYNAKMLREANSRLDAMKTFFDECNDEPRLCAGIYLPEALRRTIVQELAGAMEAGGVDTQGLPAKMRSTDMRLRRFARPSDFIWSPALQEFYPQATYWWLYARPPAE